MLIVLVDRWKRILHVFFVFLVFNYVHQCGIGIGHVSCIKCDFILFGAPGCFEAT